MPEATGGDGRAALVTGAGTGIGRACALALDAAGHRVALLGRRTGPLRRVAAECRGAVALGVDVAERAAVEAAVEAAGESLGRLDVVVANAGSFPPRRRLDETEDADWRESVATNLDGAFNTIASTLPWLRRSRGYLFGVGSVYGSGGLRLGAPYAAAKAGLAALTHTVLQEWEEHGVRATLISPGIVRTPMAGDPAEAGELLEPEDVARTVTYCLGLSDGAIVREVTLERAAVARNDRERQEDAPQWLR